MGRIIARCVAALVMCAPLMIGVVHAQNGEARSTMPMVVRTDYDMRKIMAPLPLSEAEAKGRSLFAQRCANCHGGTAQRPGPLLGQQTVERLGEAAIRDKVRKGSQIMPGFAYTLEDARIDQIVAFLKTSPVRNARDQSGTQD